MLPIGFSFREVLRKELPKMVPFVHILFKKKFQKTFYVKKQHNGSFQKSGIIFASRPRLFFVIFNPFEQAILSPDFLFFAKFEVHPPPYIRTGEKLDGRPMLEQDRTGDNFLVFFKGKGGVFLVACPYRRTPLYTLFPKTGCPYTLYGASRWSIFLVSIGYFVPIFSSMIF